MTGIYKDITTLMVKCFRQQSFEQAEVVIARKSKNSESFVKGSDAIIRIIC